MPEPPKSYMGAFFSAGTAPSGITTSQQALEWSTAEWRKQFPDFTICDGPKGSRSGNIDGIYIFACFTVNGTPHRDAFWAAATGGKVYLDSLYSPAANWAVQAQIDAATAILASITWRV